MILDILLILVSVILVILILLQQRGSLGGAVFGAGSSEVFFKRRGFEGLIFKLTWAFFILFLIFSLVRIF